MSHIDSFTVLVRNGRIDIGDQEPVQNAIFDCMVNRLPLAGNTLILIFRLGGFPDPAHQTRENLREIPSPPLLRPGGWQAPYREPITPHLFLMNIQPRFHAPAYDLWRVLWTRLRLMYAGGRMRGLNRMDAVSAVLCSSRAPQLCNSAKHDPAVIRSTVLRLLYMTQSLYSLRSTESAIYGSALLRLLLHISIHLCGSPFYSSSTIALCVKTIVAEISQAYAPRSSILLFHKLYGRLLYV